ncbi:response regulator [candidate division TA06 bacterium]|nr:response regulator [candidate division TA06 bacterium]
MPKRVLIIEGDGQSGQNLLDLTRKFGLEADLCEKVAEGLGKLVHIPYACVVLDMDSVEINPVEALIALKGISPRSYIVALTGNDEIGFEKEIRLKGVFYYLTKPIEEKEFEEVVMRASSIGG